LTTLHPLTSYGWNPFFQRQLDVAESDRVARVSAEHRGAYEVWTTGGVHAATLAGRLHHEQAAIPGVGDWVVLRNTLEGDASVVIDSILERRTLFTRGAAGRGLRMQVIAANVDLVFAVSGLDSDFNVRRIERFLARIYASGAEPAVILNKADLCDDTAAAMIEVERHCRHVPILVTSAVAGQGVGAVSAMIEEGTTVAFVGSSGAGKSSLINALAGGQWMPTGEVRESDSRGRHTTTHRQLIRLSGGGVVLDTPGMRELQLLDGDGLDEVFDDLAALAQRCRFRDCRHDGEPGCSVVAAADHDPLIASRLAHYRKLEREAEANETRHDVRLKRQAERQWGRISDEVRARRRNGGKR
jgi:ribosome biogenesis GTPase / thiamine phosphate phosphatase